jgi:alpha-beta hydrolase superfamily lysophospholipase
MGDAGSVVERVVKLPGQGSTVVWDCPGPPGAPTLVLLHGATLTAELNWSAVFPVLGRHFRVLALDQRGHGRGLGCAGGYWLEQRADDVAGLAAVLGIERLIAVGYSMGGLIAQLCWRRHPQLIAGLVLCATARSIAAPRCDHGVFLSAPDRFAAALCAACQAICSDGAITGPDDPTACGSASWPSARDISRSATPVAARRPHPASAGSVKSWADSPALNAE